MSLEVNSSKGKAQIKNMLSSIFSWGTKVTKEVSFCVALLRRKIRTKDGSILVLRIIEVA